MLKFNINVNGYMLEVAEDSHIYLESPNNLAQYWEWEDYKSWQQEVMKSGLWKELSSTFNLLCNLTGNSNNSDYFSRLQSTIPQMESPKPN